MLNKNLKLLFRNLLIEIKNHDPFVELDSEPTLIGTALVEPKCILHRVIYKRTLKNLF